MNMNINDSSVNPTCDVISICIGDMKGMHRIKILISLEAHQGLKGSVKRRGQACLAKWCEAKSQNLLKLMAPLHDALTFNILHPKCSKA